MSETAPGTAVRVWDPFVRVFHWTLVVAFAVAYITEGRPFWLHITAGFTVAGLIAARIVWGFVGPSYARFSNFAYRPSMVFGYLRDLAKGKAKRYLGHSPAGGAMVIALILSLAGTTGTGMTMYFFGKPDEPRATETMEAAPAPAADDEEAGGAPEGGRREESTLQKVHDVLANLTLFLVILHIGGVAAASFVHHENLPRAMVTGVKRN